jgi:carbonic anhydrase
MSCPNATAPVNISKAIAGDCKLKCNYSFNYKTSSLQATNKGHFLKFILDKQIEPPVVFNTEKYEVSDVRIFHPSLHTYGGKHVAAEIVVIHNAIAGASNLLVCIPVTATSNTKGVIDVLITQVASKANTRGGKTNIDLPTFSLSKVVPKAPYYNYKGTLPYEPCTGSYEYVVFGKDQALNITPAALVNLKKIITASSYDIQKPSDGLFYNSSGVSPIVSADEIYIECNPTGDDGTILIGKEKDASSTTQTPEWLENIKANWKNLLWVLIAIMIFFGSLYIVQNIGNVGKSIRSLRLGSETPVGDTS